MDGPLDVDRAVQVGVLLAGALETAHRAGIVHGDLQPARLVFGAQGEPLLVETGLAAFAVFPGLGALNNPVRYHAPPEVLERTDVTPATDVYSLATTVYALIAGRAPQQKPAEITDSNASLLLRILQMPVPPIERPGPAVGPRGRSARAAVRQPRQAPAAGDRGGLAAAGRPAPQRSGRHRARGPRPRRHLPRWLGLRPPRRRWGRRRRRPWLSRSGPPPRPSRPGPPPRPSRPGRPPSPSEPGPPPRPGSPPCPTSRSPASPIPSRPPSSRSPRASATPRPATRSGPCPRPPIPTMRSPCRACRRPETTTRPPCGATRRPPPTASRCGRPHGPPTSLRPTAPTRCGRPRGRRPTRVRRLRGRRRL